MLFDGAAAVVAADVFSAPQDPAEHSLDARADVAPSTPTTPTTPDAAPAAAPVILLVVDARVLNYQSLLADLPANVTLRVVEAQESGLAAISASLGSTRCRSSATAAPAT